MIRQIYIDHYPHYHWYLECSLGALTPGAQATIEVLVERGPSVGTMKFAASVGPVQNDPRPANNHSPDTLTVRRRSVRR